MQINNYLSRPPYLILNQAVGLSWKERQLQADA